MLQRAESAGISHRLQTSASNSEFLGKRIWQYQWVGSALLGEDSTFVCSLSRLLRWERVEPGFNGAVWLCSPG